MRIMNCYSYASFQKVVDELKKKIVGCRINNVTVINSHDFLCTLSMVKEEKLLISLNHQHPFLSLVNVKKSEPTIVGALNEALRKYLKDAYIFDIELINDDRIIHFVTQKANDYYEKIKMHIYLECIPQRANLIFVNEDNKIMHALHYSGLTTNRPILNGLSYEMPNKSMLNKKEEESSLEDIKAQAEQYYQDALALHRKEKYTPLYRFMKVRIKSLNKKIDVLHKEIDEANKHLNDVEHGNYLLAFKEDPDSLNNYLKENGLVLDPEKNIVSNANSFFKKYKKSKRTIEMASIEIQKAEEESHYLSYLLASSQFMNDDELLALSEELLPKHQSKKKVMPIKYGVIHYKGVDILYGKNASSNNELTFKVANKDDYYLHIKDYHGAHVIIRSNNPSDEIKLLAAEICLILSNMKAGEVMISPMKNVKKGHALGEAILLSYNIITIKNVRESAIALLKTH